MANTKDFKVKNGIKPTAYHEAVGTVVSGTTGYGIGNASYTGNSFVVSGQETQPYGIEFKPDGTKMYISGAVGDDINQYTLSTAWDVSTATFDNVTLATGDSGTCVVRFNNDGTKLYVNGISGDAIRQFSLTTAYDISTATFDSVTFSLLAQDNAMLGWIFKPDGTKIYAAGNVSDAVYQYSLSTAWDISTASYDNVSFDVTGQDTAPSEVLFNDSGTEMYVLGRAAPQSMYVYQLSTAWDISTATYTETSVSFANEQSSVQGAILGSNGEYLYVVGWSPLAVHQYSTTQATASLDLSTGSVFEIAPTSDTRIDLINPADSGTVSAATLLLTGVGVGYDLANASYDDVNFSVAGQETSTRAVSFKSDGTKMYVVGQTGDDINEYALSTAWDLSTATYTTAFSFSGQSLPQPTAVSFKSDGTKMLVLDTTNDAVYQYSLSTAWDVSTASYDSKSFSVSAEIGTALGMFAKDDGTKIYVTNYAGSAINEYNLSTAWDVSTATYSQSLDVSSQESLPAGTFFTPDGTIMFVVGVSNDLVYKYNLGTAWDISTASYTSISFSVVSQEGNPTGLFIKPDGAKMYITGANSDAVHQYSLISTAVITYDSAIQWAGGTAPTSPAIGETDVITFNTDDGGTTYKAVQSIDGAQ